MAEATVDRSSAAESSVGLVRRAQEGDVAAFDALARVRINRAQRLAVAILRSELDAADAVQDAFVAAWRHIPDLRDPANFDVWLERIVVNACRMALRHRRVVRVREIDVADPGEQGGGGINDLVQSAPDEHVADIELVRRAIRRLDADQRAVLVLHHVQDRPISEIAAVLRIPVGTVKWRLHEARAALQGAVEEEMR